MVLLFQAHHSFTCFFAQKIFFPFAQTFKVQPSHAARQDLEGSGLTKYISIPPPYTSPAAGTQLHK